MEQKNLSILHDYYRELERNQSRIRQICHDMKNHLAVLKELLIQGQNPRQRQVCPERLFQL